MDKDTVANAHERFKKEDGEFRKKVRRTKRLQTIMWSTCLALGVIFFAGIAVAHYQYYIALEDIAADALPILMWLTVFITTGYTVFICLYFVNARRIYHTQSVIHTRLNDQLHPDEHHPFIWHSYFKKQSSDIEISTRGSAYVITIDVLKIIIMFTLIVFCQYAWMQLMEVTGQELIDKDWAFLGLIDLTLFSSLILFAMVLISIRIGVLGKQKDPHGKQGRGNYYEPDES